MFTTFTPSLGEGRTAAGLPACRTELSLACTPGSVGRARHHAAHMLRAWHAHDDTVDAACLIVSELTTNVLCHADGRRDRLGSGGSFTLGLEIMGDLVEISVWDPNPIPPVLAAPEAGQTHGRGLVIVAMTSTRWGHRPAARGPGKVVWARLPLVRGDVPASALRDPDPQAVGD
ncbi:ATP-binding protein [Streptomyces sp. NPDC101225]|uniref:ATP-binding protein n=1 Tax=Streptomyces sp. NPDC101225 TaxID=3366135 RepID=UPI00380836A3